MNTHFGMCKKSLAIVWFVGAGVIFLLILLQTLSGKFAGEEKRAWSWYLPTVMPTLSLIIGVLVTDARPGASAGERSADPFLFRLAMSLSTTYFLVVLLLVLAEPFTTLTLLELMDLSSLWLGPLQGIVTASLGVFFVRSQPSRASHQAWPSTASISIRPARSARGAGLPQL
jgi:hypothetical protein